MADTFDVIVVGGGPGGYVCAIHAAQLGLKTAVVERDRLGGICLNWGCIPTKALLRSSEIWHLLHRLGEFGFSADNLKFDLAKIVERSRKVSQQLSNGVSFLMKKHKIAVIPGEARLSGGGKLVVTKDGISTEIAGQNIVLATGARARTLPGLEPDGNLIWTYREAMIPASFPKSLLVVGSGAIGIEFASFFRTLGSDVTVVEVLDRVLPVEDEEISQLAHKAFVKQGMKIKVSTTVEKLEKGADNVTATLKAKDGASETITAERVILAVGIVGNVENIGLDRAGVKVEKTHVVVDEWGGTGVPGLWAIGDLVGPPWLAHKAMHEGVIVAERIAGVKGIHPLDTSKVPGCTYCWPQVASVGMTEAKAKASGRKIKVGRFPFIGNGKAIALGDAEGLVKTVFDADTGELLGAHMIGAEVTELIQGYAIARAGELTDVELASTIFPHPTLSEMLHEAVLDADKKALHI
ncbi:MAG: dihydrolipoyl dehydrogenase [Alphaproteobacteria bacterium]|nr:dihydrolipoyl dehydrogenase [Alphaproteobacteria bacterium]MDE2631111.1 dihydrolipoyl dehydrogenase [Alphaproteobacteria bacterium]